MKIAIITETFPPTGVSGVSSAHYNLFRLFKENNYNVKVFTFNDDADSIKSFTDDPDVFHFGISAKMRHHVRVLISKMYKYQRKIFFKTDTYLLAYQIIDIVISNLGSRKINKDLKIFNPDVVILPDHGVPGFSIKKVKGAQYIHISHHNPIRFINNPFWGYQSEYDARLAVKIEKKALQKVDKVICPSAYMKDVFISTYGDKLPVTVIPNLIDNKFVESIKPVSVHEKLSLDSDLPVVYIPSGGSSYKGERFVIEIIRRLAVLFQFKIGFYISGGLSASQQEELGALKIYTKLVYSPGYVENDVNIGYIKGCTICVTPTLVENFSMAILEANFCNVPVVTFNVGGNKDIIEDGENGYLVPYFDMESLIMRASEIIQSNTRLNTFLYVDGKFSAKAVAPQYKDYFKNAN